MRSFDYAGRSFLKRWSEKASPYDGQSPRLLLRDNLLEDALSRAYYAILHAARAVFLAEGVNVTSHRAVRRLFGQHLIKSGKLSAHLATILAEEQDDRILADYDVLFDLERERV
jgi:uncharacterized protein (UPF0332 family)